ncbi:MAG: decaprenyl-phosphate phosphoribosyltransferase [Chloroflexi bacterium]|nr:decaprenyl-phosphate phosphoribosyltransferase [Chloroflexota bacterium]
MALIEAFRPRQWTKNVLLFVGVVFAVRLLDVPSLVASLIAFLVFCAVSSAVYLMNDLLDSEADRQHPRKRSRPIASGRLSPATATIAAAVLAIGGLGVAAAVRLEFGAIVAAYLILNGAYNLGLKRVLLIDLFTLAAFYVLRAVAGAVAIAVPISPWLYLCTILAALFLGLAKRRHELILLGESAADHRLILREYNAPLLEQMITIVTASLIMAYSLYTFSADNLPDDHTMMLTIPIVVFGIFRYLFLVHRRDAGGSPEDLLLGDRPLTLTVVSLAVVSVAVLYLHRMPG